MDKNNFLAFLAIAMILISGCIGGNGDPGQGKQNGTTGSNVTIVNITVDHGQKNNTLNESNENAEKQNYSIYSYEPKRTLNIYFFQLSSAEKNGRAVLVKKGDFDMLIDSGISESYGKFYSLVSSISDDIEVYVISSNAPENIENAENVIKKLKVAEIWYSDEKGIENLLKEAENDKIATRKVSRGDTFSYNGIEFLAMNPGDEDNFADFGNSGIVLYAEDRNFSALLTNYILEGAMGKISDIYKDKLKSTLLEMPNFGERIGQMSTRVFLNYAKPEFTVIEGKIYPDRQKSPKSAVYNLLDLSKTKYYENGNSSLVILYDGNTYGVSYLAK